MKTVSKEMLAQLNAEIFAFNRDRDVTLEYMKQFSAHDAVCEEKFTIQAPLPTFTNTQGGCCVGKYYFQAFNHTIKTEAGFKDLETIIAKYDIEADAVIKYSRPFELHHANDITYHPARNQLIIVHNRPYRNQISFMDPDTLDLLDTVVLERDIFSIAYNPLRDCYAVGKSGGQDFAILDANFKPIADHTALTTRFVTQGMTCDDDYIYFAQHNKHCIMKYDWEGNFVEFLPFSKKNHEPENISFIDGKLHVCFGEGKGAATYYEVTFKKTE